MANPVDIVHINNDVLQQISNYLYGGKTNSNNNSSTGNGSGGNNQQKTKSLKSLIDTVRRLDYAVSSIVRLSGQLIQPWTKADQAAANFAKTIGMSAKGMAQLRTEAIKLVSKEGLGALYGISTDALLKLQENYAKTVGRNVTVGKEGLKNFAASSKLLGEEGAVQWMAKLENFGLSMTDAGRMAGQLFSSSAKKGIAWEKTSKNFLDNIKLAQNYTFKDGLKGLARMAEKAAAIKLDMNQASAFAEQVGTVEGAIKTGASLQVLGGAFAQFANPMQMLYEGISDMEGLQNRIINMFGGFGRWNAQKGMVDISAIDRMRIKEAAKATGIDYSNIMESIQSQGRAREIEKQIKGRNNLNKDVVELLKNVGVIENGVAGYYKLNGEFVKASEVTNNDLEELQNISRSESDDVKQIAANLRGMEDTINGIKTQMEAITANWTNGIGGKIKGGLQWLGGSNGFVGTLAGISLASQILNNRMGYGFGNAGLWGKAGNWIGKSRFGDAVYKTMYTTGGKIAGIGGIIGGAVGTYFGNRGAEELRQLGLDRREGRSIRGTNEDNLRNRRGILFTSGGYGAALGSTIGSLSGVAGAASIGAGLGSVAPLIGTAIGAGVGLIAGGITSAIQKRNNQESLKIRNSLLSRGYSFSGDYKKKEFEQIQQALSDKKFTESEFYSLSNKTKEKLLKSGDIDMFPELHEIKTRAENMTVNASTVRIAFGKGKGFSAGGYISGPGSSTSDSIPAFLSNGESVMTARATKMFGPQLSIMNRLGGGSGEFGVSPIKPSIAGLSRGMIDVKAPAPGSIGSFSASSVGGSVQINFSPIKLEMPNGTSRDMTNEILSNPTFVNALTRKIEEGLNRSEGFGSLTVNQGYKYLASK